MLKRTLAAVFTVLLLMIGLTTTSASAAPGGTDRPFKATATGQIYYDTTNPRGCPAADFLSPVPFTSTLTASGRATHLGAFTVSATHCESLGVSSNGQMTLTAANGDQLFGTYATTWAAVGDRVVVEGDLVLDGGTGRFTHATGTLKQHHLISYLTDQPWLLQMSFTGPISY